MSKNPQITLRRNRGWGCNLVFKDETAKVAVQLAIEDGMALPTELETAPVQIFWAEAKGNDHYTAAGAVALIRGKLGIDVVKPYEFVFDPKKRAIFLLVNGDVVGRFSTNLPMAQNLAVAGGFARLAESLGVPEQDLKKMFPYLYQQEEEQAETEIEEEDEPEITQEEEE